METLPEQHPAAVAHLPGFITPPGDTDTLLIGTLIFLLAMILLTGVFYLKLHSLPERMTHGAPPAQFQIVAVLGLISLLTHNQLFWIAALLLAMVDIRSIMTPLTSMSRSLYRMSMRPTRSDAEATPPAPQDPARTEETRDA